MKVQKRPWIEFRVSGRNSVARKRGGGVVLNGRVNIQKLLAGHGPSLTFEHERESS
ncbi:hypothetical protein FHU30_002652 [Actinomadura rupiterrae]|nr:hypothetical protein [Actinomadura rupiterrae]